MPKQSKTKTTTDVVETATVPVVNTVIDVAAVEKVKKVKAPKAKVDAVVTETPVQTTAPVQTAVTDVVESVDVESDLTAQSTEFLAKLSQLSTLLASLKVEYRTLEKRWVRELKTAQKTQAKRKRKSGNRAPSGFVKPTKISDELAKFLEKPVGSEMARTDVTREINTYIRKHNLQDKENGRKINPDVKLQTLLKLNKTDELTYFNLQRYMSPHFSKAVKEVVA
jgi:upstream activation factor subunit UAF30